MKLWFKTRKKIQIDYEKMLLLLFIINYDDSEKYVIFKAG